MIRTSIFSIRNFLIFLFVLCSLFSKGQRTNFRFYQYNKENKLNEEFVKSIQQDSLGTYYFATDHGVLFLSNDHFIPFTIPEGNSGYFKELFKRTNGDLLAVSDDAIYKLTNSREQPKIELFIECNITPSKPKYPKHLFEDSKNDLWISDYNHIYRYQEGIVEKYKMDEKNMTSSYARSFQFLECNNGNLIAISQKGWFYVFDSQRNEFIESDFNLNLTIHSSFKIGSNEFLIGTSEGVIKIIFDSKGKVIRSEVIIDNIIVSCFERISENKILLGTWFQGLVELDITDKYSISPVGGFSFITINDIFLDDFGKYWLSTNSGAVIMEKQFFSSQFTAANSEYIRSICLTDNGKINFAGPKNIFNINRKGDIESLPIDFEGSLIVFKTFGDLTLLGTEQGRLQVFKGESLLLNLDLSGQAITSIQVASEEIVWVVANKELFKINISTGQIKSYLDAFQGKRIVQDICLDTNQNLYIGGQFKHSYLFKYDFDKNEIFNVSLPISFAISDDFWVIDLELDQDTLYMGTSEGLLKYTGTGIERINFGEASNGEVNSIAIDKQHSLWFTTSKGVVCKRKAEISLFTPDQGLPSKTITNRNLVVDSQNTLWVGTTNGIAFANISDSILSTPIPIVYLADKENEVILQNSSVSMLANAMLLLDVVASIYPQKQNKFQFCTVKSSQEHVIWRDLSAKNQILISDLKPGEYQICIRGKHEGNFTWSEHCVIHLSVEQLWYLRWYTIAIEFLLVVLIIIATNEYSKRRTQKNLLELEKIVSERTIQLQSANESLSSANVAKDKFLSIIAHDLRNPFNAIRGFSKILLKDSDILSEDEKNELIETIYRSSDDTFKLLESLLEWANVQKGNFKLNVEEFDLKNLLEKNIGIHKSLGLLKGLHVIGEFDSVTVKADKAMIDTVIRNLLSNAIKFSFPGQTIELKSYTKNGNVVIHVSDQGIGMTEKQLEQLFKIDTVFTSEGTANETGTGFGLMLSKEFVELNGGKIWAESVKDKGTSFFFSIPKIK